MGFKLMVGTSMLKVLKFVDQSVKKLYEAKEFIERWKWISSIIVEIIFSVGVVSYMKDLLIEHWMFAIIFAIQIPIAFMAIKELKNNLSEKKLLKSEIKINEQNLLIEKLITNASNLFSEDFARDIYNKNLDRDVYSRYRIELSNVKAFAIGLLPINEPLPDLLTELDDELEEIKKKDILSTIVNSNIDIILGLQKKYLRRFNEAKSGLLKKYCSIA